MICVFPPDATDFSTNGMGAVDPHVCTVTETLNGEWELTLEHMIDDAGKWARLAERNIVLAPVPAAMTPAMIAPAVQATSVDVYRVQTDGRRLNMRAKPSLDAKIIRAYKPGTDVISLGVSGSWREVTAPDGARGYMWASNTVFVRTETTGAQGAATVVEAKQLRDQPFRIYRIVPSLDKVTVYARHLFYDLMDNMIQSYKPAATATGAQVLAGIAAGCLSAHDFTFASDLASTADEAAFVNMNPVDAILGADGLIEKYGGELARDWYDVYVVNRVGEDAGVQVREGKNLLGISYDVDITDVVTRIMPTGETKDGKTLYLDELYMDSPHIGDYPHPKWIHLAVSEAKVSNDMTTAQAKAKMRTTAQAEFDKGCDLPTVTLTVDFINCADTEEYSQYAALQNIFLGDGVRVLAKRVGVAVTMRLTQYTYDCLTRKYTAMTLGTVADSIEGNVISARQLASGTITGAKLAMGSVGAGQLRDGSVGSLQIGLAAIQTAHIETAAIQTAHIQDAAITNAKIGGAAIDTANIKDAAITTAKVADLAVTSAKIADLTVGTAKITDLAVTTAKIAQAAITNAKIANAAINTAQIALGAITTALIANGAIGTAQIEDGSITSAKIVSLNADVITTGTLSVERLLLQGADGLYYAINADAGGLTSAQLSEDQYKIALSGTVLVAKSVTAAQIAAGTITANELAAGAITAAKIAAGAITAVKIATGAIETTHISAAAQSALVLAAGESIAVGGENLLRHSGSPDYWNLWGSGGAPTHFDFTPDALGFSVRRYAAAGAGYVQIWFGGLSANAMAQKLTAGETYTFSVLCAGYGKGIDLRARYSTNGSSWSGDEWSPKTFSAAEADGYHRLSCTITPAVSGLYDFGVLFSATASGQYVDLARPKVEVGNKATDWSLNPEEFVAGSTIRMDKDAVDISTPTFRVNVQGTNGDLTLDETGMTVSEINSPSVTKRYRGPDSLTVNPSGAVNGKSVFASLTDAFSALSGRWLDYNVTITMAADTAEDVAELSRVYGARVSVEGGNHALSGRISVSRVNLFSMRELSVSAVSAGAVVDLVRVGRALLTGCAIQNAATGGYLLLADEHTAAHLTGCALYGAWCGVAAMNQSHVLMEGCTGAAGTYAAWSTTGSDIRIYGSTRPAGALANGEGGTLTDSSTAASGGTTPSAPVSYTTTTYTANLTGWYDGAWASSKTPTQLRQGYATYTLNEHTGQCWGCAWFDLSALSGKTAAAAGLRLARVSGQGRGGAVDVHLYGVSNTSRSGAPNVTADYGVIGTVDQGATIKATIPAAAAQALIDGTIGGLCVYQEDDTAVWGARNYSYDYAQFCGTETSGNAPQITIKYS